MVGTNPALGVVRKVGTPSIRMWIVAAGRLALFNTLVIRLHVVVLDESAVAPPFTVVVNIA